MTRAVNLRVPQPKPSTSSTTAPTPSTFCTREFTRKAHEKERHNHARTNLLPATCQGWRHPPPERSDIEMKPTRRYVAGLAAVVTTAAGLLAATGLGAGVANASGIPAFVGPLHHITTLASTVPANGDVNPYGVAVIPRSTGPLGRDNVLVSNFNNKANVQDTGTTILQ